MLPRLWAKLTAATGRLWGGQCLSDPRVWLGEPTRANVWVWARLSQFSELASNADGMGWTESYSLHLQPGEIFISARCVHQKPGKEPGKWLRGCSEIDWPGGREVSGL